MKELILQLKPKFIKAWHIFNFEKKYVFSWNFPDDNLIFPNEFESSIFISNINVEKSLEVNK